MVMSSGEPADPVGPMSDVMERFDWLFMKGGDLDEETCTYLLRLTMKGQDWICWQIMEPWW